MGSSVLIATDWGTWSAVGTDAAAGVAIILLLWKLVSTVSGWRTIDAQAMGKLAHLFAGWMDQTDEHLNSQDDQIYDVLHRLHKVEETVGIDNGRPLTRKHGPSRSRRLEATEVFGPPGEFGIDIEGTEADLKSDKGKRP